jgi:hypothetical protein
VIARVDEAGLQLIGCGRGLHLLLYAAAFIGQLDDELCHGKFSPVPRFRGRKALKELLLLKVNSLDS